jgi:FkbM family methyltransferase
MARGNMTIGLPLVYDFGMNNGDDVDYYLAKGCRVIAVEANPALCESGAKRFPVNIADGTLKILNCAVSDREGTAEFFIHDQYSGLSTLAPDAARRSDIEMNWTRIPVTLRQASSIIREFGEPLYVKVDVEFVDHIVLRDLLVHAIKPPYISAESHLIDVYCCLVSMGYEKFKLLDGKSVPTRFRDYPIARFGADKVNFSFGDESSGPFGEDIPGPWIDKTRLLGELMETGLGWKDIHAKRD